MKGHLTILTTLGATQLDCLTRVVHDGREIDLTKLWDVVLTLRTGIDTSTSMHLWTP